MGKHSILVTVSKSYKYPIGSLNKRNPYEDARFKAENDFIENWKEFRDNPIGMFKIEALDDTGWKVRNIKQGLMPMHDRGQFPTMVDLNLVLKTLTESTLEKEIGELNPDKNKQIFEYEPEVKNKEGEIVQPETYYLIHKYQEKYSDIYASYLKQLNKILR